MNTFQQQQIVIWKREATSFVLSMKTDDIIQHFFLQHTNINMN